MADVGDVEQRGCLGVMLVPQQKALLQKAVALLRGRKQWVGVCYNTASSSGLSCYFLVHWDVNSHFCMLLQTVN